jgi:hypothetical protein
VVAAGVEKNFSPQLSSVDDDDKTVASDEVMVAQRCEQVALPTAQLLPEFIAWVMEVERSSTKSRSAGLFSSLLWTAPQFASPVAGLLSSMASSRMTGASGNTKPAAPPAPPAPPRAVSPPAPTFVESAPAPPAELPSLPPLPTPTGPGIEEQAARKSTQMPYTGTNEKGCSTSFIFAST